MKFVLHTAILHRRTYMCACIDEQLDVSMIIVYCASHMYHRIHPPKKGSCLSKRNVVILSTATRSPFLKILLEHHFFPEMLKQVYTSVNDCNNMLSAHTCTLLYVVHENPACYLNHFAAFEVHCT